MNEQQRIRQHFKRAAHTYQQQATAQQRIAQALAQRLPANQHYQQAIEIGAGTGLLTQIIDQRCTIEHWNINDLCPELLQQLPQLNDPQPNLIVGNATDIDLTSIHPDLFLSANAIHWLNDPIGYLREVIRQLQQQAHYTLLVSTFGADNLREIRSLTQQGLHYPPLSEYQQLSPQMKVSDQLITLNFPSPRHVLQHLRDTGVTALNGEGKPTLANRRQLQQFITDYQERYGQADGTVTLTYHAIYLHLTHDNKAKTQR